MPRALPSYADAPPERETRPPGSCHGWPFCRLPGTMNGACPAHREAYDRVRAALKWKAKGTPREPVVERDGLTITHVDPTPTGIKRKRPKAKPAPLAPPAERRPSPAAAAMSLRILAALAAGPLGARRLAEACGVEPGHKNWSRARNALRDAGTIALTGPRGKASTYRLGEPQPSAHD
jgi:hypothetical protein